MDFTGSGSGKKRLVLLRDAGLAVKDIIGLTYNPLTKHYKLAADVDVNYMIQTLRKE